MNTEDSNRRREYTLADELIHNLPYILMVLLGAGIFLAGLGASVWGWISAGLYILYGLAGSLWIILFLCPYCRRYGTRSCPSGYGLISARLRKRQDFSRFAEKFKKHIPVIVPLWFIPPIFGVIFEIRRFDWLLLVLLAAFAVDAFVVLPLTSKKHGCKNCPQRNDCPWMKGKK
ncbi:MAG: hypothetical protein SVV80_11265 [Planctomycetota bacterium]|nr:hypothetical protein [Planctomycetota bacterium]